MKTEVPIKARKQWVCDWCGEDIKKGDTYVRVIVSNGHEGENTAYVPMHPECNEVAEDDDTYRRHKQVRGLRKIQEV